MVQLIREATPGQFMPKEGPRLAPEEVALIERWIDEGLAWDSAPRASASAAPLALRRVELPGPDGGNLIDRILAPYFEEHGIDANALADDRTFARRATLDVVGLLPSPADMRAFLADKRPERRAEFTARLLADRRGYAEHWISFWNDLLRNDFRGNGAMLGRKDINYWLYGSIAANKPFDQFARELLNPNASTDAFLRGVQWDNTQSASQSPAMQAAQSVSQVFLGASIKCASCHDSVTNQWKLSDAYGLAAVFSDEPLEMVKCDAPTGKTARAQFVYPELGSIDPEANRAERLGRLAELMTAPGNGRFARSIVNRIWERFFGRGLIEPLDDIDAAAWHPDLLDTLALDFAENGYDLRRLTAQIVESKAYQLPSNPRAPLEAGPYIFRGPHVRRLSAEQLLDAISQITGDWPETAEVEADFKAGIESIENRENRLRATMAGARWIWPDTDPRDFGKGSGSALRKLIQLEGLEADPIVKASLVVYAKVNMDIILNGKLLFSRPVHLGATRASLGPIPLDVTANLREGTNNLTIALLVDGTPPNCLETWPGVLAYGRIERKSGAAIEFVSDDSWRMTRKQLPESRMDDSDEGWVPPVLLAEFADPPRDAEPRFIAAAMTRLYTTSDQIRAWRLRPDSLAYALGRPERDQIVSRRPAEASRLQLLEMMNGEAFADRISTGARRLSSKAWTSPSQFVVGLYSQALSRPPSPGERAAGEAALGTPIEAAAIEDLLWAVALLPEFQLIY